MKFGWSSSLFGIFYVYLTATTVVHALESSILKTGHIAAAHGRAAMSHKRHWGTKYNTTASSLGHHDELVKRDGTKYVFMHHVGCLSPLVYLFVDLTIHVQIVGSELLSRLLWLIASPNCLIPISPNNPTQTRAFTYPSVFDLFD